MFFASAVRANRCFGAVRAGTGINRDAIAGDRDGKPDQAGPFVIAQGPGFSGRPRYQQTRYATVDLPFGEFREGGLVQLITVKGSDEVADSAVRRDVDPGTFTHFQFPSAWLLLSVFGAQTVSFCEWRCLEEQSGRRPVGRGVRRASACDAAAETGRCGRIGRRPSDLRADRDPECHGPAGRIGPEGEERR